MTAATAPAAAPAPAPEAGPAPAIAHPSGKPQWVDAAPQVPADIVLERHLREARDAGQDVVVYVGAAWCPPCHAFHDALTRGELDDRLPGVRFVAFDHDADGDRLKALGYRWEFVPLFARPRVDGRASGRQVAGVPKEALGAPLDHLVAQLDALLDRRPAAAAPAPPPSAER